MQNYSTTEAKYIQDVLYTPARAMGDIHVVLYSIEYKSE